MNLDSNQNPYNPGSAPGSKSEPSFEDAWRGLKGAGRELFNSVRDVLSSGSKEALHAFREAAIDALDWMAADPKIGRRGADSIVSILPIIGSSKLLADARVIYFKGKEDNDDNLKENGKKLCLLACLSAGMDVVSLGVSALPRNTLMRTMLAETLLRGGTAALDEVTDGGLSELLNDLMTDPKVSKAMESILEATASAEKRSVAADHIV